MNFFRRASSTLSGGARLKRLRTGESSTGKALLLVLGLSSMDPQSVPVCLLSRNLLKNPPFTFQALQTASKRLK